MEDLKTLRQNVEAYEKSSSWRVFLINAAVLSILAGFLFLPIHFTASEIINMPASELLFHFGRNAIVGIVMAFGQTLINKLFYIHSQKKLEKEEKALHSA